MRTRPKKKLTHAPLSLVLAQVRFSPLFLMGEYVPRIQDQLRQKGYPVNASVTVKSKDGVEPVLECPTDGAP